MSIAHRVKELSSEVIKAATACGRDPTDVAVLAATKYASVAQINEALAAGIVRIGENKVKDAQEKFPLIKPCRRHYIGKVQSNKIATIVELFDAVETIENKEHATLFESACAKQKKRFDACIEVNIGKEPQKSGVNPNDVAELVEHMRSFRYCKLIGLMCLGPNLSSGHIRPFFSQMRNLAMQCGLSFLSFGMSHTFEVGIQEGSTQIRVGQRLFA